jgi:hypothetical protein
MKPIFLVFLCAATCFPLAAQQKPQHAYSIPTPGKPDFANLNWLVGQWAGKTVEKRTKGEVLLSAAYELGHRFIVVREQLSLPATKDAPATHEGEMGILSADPSRNGFDLDLYSSHGFVSHYHVTATKDEVDFNPEGGLNPPSGWLFRWVIIHSGVSQCTVHVEVAPPGQPFFNYYTALLSQVTSGTTTSAGATAPVPKGTPPKRKWFSFWRGKRQETDGAGGGS